MMAKTSVNIINLIIVIICILILIFLPEVALANLILPTLVVTMPIMWLSLVAVIAVEVLVLNYLWPEAKIKPIIISTSIGNCVSTLVGVPVAWVLYYFGITLPVMIFSDLFFEIAMKLPKALVAPIGFIVGAPIIMDMNDWLETLKTNSFALKATRTPIFCKVS
jgi:hypothetical protein